MKTRVCLKYFLPDCRISTQLSEYFWRRPDPEAKFIDAFTVNWCLYLCFLFPSLSLLLRLWHKIQVEQVESSNCSILLANPTLVQSNLELSSTRTSDFQTQCNILYIATSQTPINIVTVTDNGSTIREKYSKLGYSENTRNILLASWRPGTLLNYSK